MTNNICIYCGSAVGIKAEYAEVTRKVGRSLAHHGLGLVYGGGRVGLMGILADSVLQHGGQAIGVIPAPLATKEIAHDGLTELHVVADMHERKAMMASRAIAFLTLPGGIGTFEEFFETLSWSVLGLHQKPLGILNVGGYFDPMLAMIEHGVTERFVRTQHLGRLLVSSDPDTVIGKLIRHASPGPPAQAIDFEKSS